MVGAKASGSFRSRVGRHFKPHREDHRTHSRHFPKLALKDGDYKPGMGISKRQGGLQTRVTGDTSINRPVKADLDVTDALAGRLRSLLSRPSAGTMNSSNKALRTNYNIGTRLTSFVIRSLGPHSTVVRSGENPSAEMGWIVTV